MEIDENGHSDATIDYEMNRQKARQKKTGCAIIRINAEKNLEIFKAFNEIFRYIKQLSNELTEKSLVQRVLLRLIRLEFKSVNRKIESIRNKTSASQVY